MNTEIGAEQNLDGTQTEAPQVVFSRFCAAMGCVTKVEANIMYCANHSPSHPVCSKCAQRHPSYETCPYAAKVNAELETKGFDESAKMCEVAGCVQDKMVGSQWCVKHKICQNCGEPTHFGKCKRVEPEKCDHCGDRIHPERKCYATSVLRMQEAAERQIFASGAQRGTDRNNVRYDLICPTGLRRLAETYAEGAEKYDDNNWCKGIPIRVMVNHAFAHLEMYNMGDTSEDHLAHATWNLIAIMHYEENCAHHEHYDRCSNLDERYLRKQEFLNS